LKFHKSDRLYLPPIRTTRNCFLFAN
jgi:hypothetical protein